MLLAGMLLEITAELGIICWLGTTPSCDWPRPFPVTPSSRELVRLLVVLLALLVVTLPALLVVTTLPPLGRGGPPCERGGAPCERLVEEVGVAKERGEEGTGEEEGGSCELEFTC